MKEYRKQQDPIHQSSRNLQAGSSIILVFPCSVYIHQIYVCVTLIHFYPGFLFSTYLYQLYFLISIPALYTSFFFPPLSLSLFHPSDMASLSCNNGAINSLFQSHFCCPMLTLMSHAQSNSCDMNSHPSLFHFIRDVPHNFLGVLCMLRKVSSFFSIL